MEQSDLESLGQASVSELDAEIERLEQELGENRCDHEATQLRRRTFANGSIHFVLQCCGCGEQQGGPIGTKAAQIRLNGAEAPPFDVGLPVAYQQQRSHLVGQIEALTRSRRELVDPEAGASFQAVDAERQQAKSHIADIVTRCREELHTELADDEQVADVLAATAVSIRKAARDARVAEASRFASEPELKLWLERYLSDDFDLTREVTGKHLAEGAEVGIDYIAFPRPHLVEAGFAAIHFGIEVKFLDPCNGFSRRAARALWQTVSYTDSVFDLSGQPVRLKYAVLFSNLSFDDERSLLKNLGSRRENDHIAWQSLLQLANHANVGTIYINGTRQVFKGWKLAFSGGTYFSRRQRGNKADYHLTNPRMVEKVRVGNF